jgi:hypothetical protein
MKFALITLAVALFALPLFSAVRCELGLSGNYEIAGTAQFTGSNHSWGFTAGRIDKDSFFGVVHEYSIGQRLIGRFGVGAGLLNAVGVLAERNVGVSIQGGHFGLYALVSSDVGVGIYWTYRGVAGHELSAQYLTLIVQFDI